MTEQEAIKEFEERLAIADYRDNIPKYYEAMELAVKDMKEIQKYRAIGTPDKIKEELDHLRNDNDCQGFYFTLEERQDLARQHRELEEYRAIGTPEECRAAVEKQIPKKIVYRKSSYGTPYLCSICEAEQVKTEFFNSDGSKQKEKYTYCWGCGTKIDWSDEE